MSIRVSASEVIPNETQCCMLQQSIKLPVEQLELKL